MNGLMEQMGFEGIVNTQLQQKYRKDLPKLYSLILFLGMLTIWLLFAGYWLYYSIKARNDYPLDDGVNYDNVAGISLFDHGMVILVAGAIVIIGFFIALNTEQIKSWAYRHVIPNKGMHRLSMQDIFENSNRILILQTISNSPGVHFNELRRKTDLAQGQLSWHLEVLDQYGIIHKEEVGQYVVYFPSVKEGEGQYRIPLAMEKSKTTVKILEIIEKDSGITASNIGRLIGLKRNSVKYHLDKLIEHGRIKSEKYGRINKLYSLHQP
ncbi:MAG: winged helix-turn-helix transcriptional regulator [Promethearchaeota archaeon]|nr:MAG: winged helix-turn-helix transcriptional regulator [Candidatus Lokiarchaeota archaeon]